jgi:hypothetical protein
MPRIAVAPHSEIARLLHDAVAAGEALEVDAGDTVYRLADSVPVDAPIHRDLQHLAHRLAGSLADVNIPGWESSESAEWWVANLR